MAARSGTSGARPWVLGISASHNGAACLLHGDEIVCAIQEERLTRSKRERIEGAQPSLAVQYCLDAAGIAVTDLALVVLCTQESMTEARHDIWLNPQLRLKANGIPAITIPHHLGHAVCALALSGEDRAAILVVDGAGSPAGDLGAAEAATVRTAAGSEAASLYVAEGGVITPLEKYSSDGREWLERREQGMPTFSSLGGMYSAVATQIFGDPMEAGKVMGLAPMGRATIPSSDFFEEEDGFLRFKSDVPDRYRDDVRWPNRRQEYADLARSVQNALEEALLAIARRLKAMSGSDALCYAGGVALNGIANERILREAGFDRLYIPAAAEDSGTAIGAAFHGLWQIAGYSRRPPAATDRPGCSYDAASTVRALGEVPFLRSVDLPAERLNHEVVRRLIAGQIGGWFRGGSELGPRALGQRSILADPRRADAKGELNARVKKREDFRPFAPAVLVEEAAAWFDCEELPSNPFMLRIWKFREGLGEKVPAVVHSDASGRAQTVAAGSSPELHALIRCFADSTGIPILLNTSFNGPGEPIVETPEDALWCMIENGLDFLVLDGRMVSWEGEPKQLLDLIPTIRTAAYKVLFRRESGGGAEDRPERLEVTTSTRWGSFVGRLPVSTLALLDLIDGRRTGHAIRAALEGEGIRLSEQALTYQLGRMRSKGVISLGAGPQAAVPERAAAEPEAVTTPA